MPLMAVIEQPTANRQAHTNSPVPYCDSNPWGFASGGGMVNLCSCAIQMNTGGNIAFIYLAFSHQPQYINSCVFFFFSPHFS